MSTGKDHTEYQQALDKIAHAISHRLRKPIATMLGLLELIQPEVLKGHDYHQTLTSFKTHLDQLDQYSREPGCLIHPEQSSLREDQP